MVTTFLSDLLCLPADKRADLVIALWESLSDAERDQVPTATKRNPHF